MFSWFDKWVRDNSKDPLPPAIVTGAAGAAVVAAVLIVVWGGPQVVEATQTGPRGTAMAILERPGDNSDPTILDYYTEPPWIPEGGEELARDAYENVQVLGDLTVDNFNRLMGAITFWVSPEEGCNYCHVDEGMASDDLYTKRVARNMIQMTQSINESWGDHVQQTGVNCYTCHRGENVPSGVWFDVTPVNEAAEGWSAVQNRVTPVSEWTSLPSDALMEYLVEYGAIRVHDLDPRVPNEGTATIQDTERTYSLMNHFSNALDVNCTFCHNSRAFYDLDQSTPQLLTAQLGIAMVLELNNDWILPLADELPPERLGPKHADVPKAACQTCHKGYSKPLNGTPMLEDWPELATSDPPVYE